MASPEEIPLSGDASIDGLLTRYKWDDNSITYSFPSSGFFYIAEALTDTLSPGQVVEFLALNALNGSAAAVETYAEFAPITVVAGVGFQEFNSPQKDFARYALEQFDAVSGLTLIESSEDYFRHQTLRFAETGVTGDAPAFGIPPLPRVETLFGNGVLGDAWFQSNGQFDVPVVGNFAAYTIMHETGHVLGLKHGHEAGLLGGDEPEFLGDVLTAVSGDPLPRTVDSFEFSVMTYRSEIGRSAEDGLNRAEDSGYPQSLMMLDIQAIQYMYGADFSTNAENTIYEWNPDSGQMSVNGDRQEQPGENRVFRTIWDGGGTDTYDLSKYSNFVEIDLRPGEWTTTATNQLADLDKDDDRGSGLARGNVANALLYNGDTRSLIETGIGGRGDDTITGNNADNRLIGNEGNDVIRGGFGGDTLTGGSGTDTLRGEIGDDMLFGGIGDDTLDGGSGNDELAGGIGDDTAIFMSVLAEYSIESLAGGGTRVTDTVTGRDGLDQLVGVENLEFTDQIVIAVCN